MAYSFLLKKRAIKYQIQWICFVNGTQTYCKKLI
jgi:hypothetical protein